MGVKAEVEKTPGASENDESGAAGQKEEVIARRDWLEMSVDIPGQRDDDAGTVFLSEMLREALLADGECAKKLWINRRFHWRLYLDVSILLSLHTHIYAEADIFQQVILISPPMSYPLPLLSLTTHLALLATRLPRLKSEGDEDPMFDDDWEASKFLYSPDAPGSRPAITLLVVALGDNIIFDPSKDELAVAETALAVSVAEVCPEKGGKAMEVDSKGRSLRLLSVRTIDPPSRLTAPGVPNEMNTATNTVGAGTQKQLATAQNEPIYGVWRAPLGGTKFGVMDAIIRAVLEKGGVGEEVLDALEGVDLA